MQLWASVIMAGKLSASLLLISNDQSSVATWAGKRWVLPAEIEQHIQLTFLSQSMETM